MLPFEVVINGPTPIQKLPTKAGKDGNKMVTGRGLGIIMATASPFRFRLGVRSSNAQLSDWSRWKDGKTE